MFFILVPYFLFKKRDIERNTNGATLNFPHGVSAVHCDRTGRQSKGLFLVWRLASSQPQNVAL